jgi:hypothetical protein
MFGSRGTSLSVPCSRSSRHPTSTEIRDIGSIHYEMAVVFYWPLTLAVDIASKVDICMMLR